MTLADALSGIYAALLYAYPREFRLEFGGEMKRLFRDRCNDVARTNDPCRMLRFAAHSATDWMATTMRERADSMRAIVSTARKPVARGSVGEWAATILIYLFATTTLVQAYVIPTGSMEGTLRVGDHLLVDRMAYEDPGPFGRHILPYRDIQRGDIVTFHFPEDTRQTFVKRVIGLPGDRIRLRDKQVIRNGRRLLEPYTRHIDPGVDTYRDDFPATADFRTTPRGRDMFEHHVVGAEVVVPPDSLFVLGDNRDNWKTAATGDLYRANISPVSRCLFIGPTMRRQAISRRGVYPMCSTSPNTSLPGLAGTALFWFRSRSRRKKKWQARNDERRCRSIRLAGPWWSISP